ncbi:uncharacterized protein EDB93DRAFT_1134121 [Suillus bovinus]|uniref:uncharacterized protein n=1 Tax=Suillus bovinus TaxID=48563 RepID=UPI001B87354A|nr:uncharacterized protein EDB93DRAFT_1134121 [Suillus bovinus]KAG2153680.1 hypothetical protein EDB93DRAFT_1134121 [Suillus bovinus]
MNCRRANAYASYTLAFLLRSTAMSKHRLSPVPLPPAKRLHHTRISSQEHRLITTFDNALYDELILFIFSFLNCRDLCAMHRTNRNCSRLASDNQLWKTLFIREFGKTRLRGGKGFYGLTDGRLVKPLPLRASTSMSSADDTLDWKWMHRISSNWRNGRCSVEHFTNAEGTTLAPPPAFPRQHVILAGGFTISSSNPCGSSLLVRDNSGISRTLLCRSTLATSVAEISAIALDQSPPSLSSSHIIRLAAFLTTGEFNIFEHDHSSLSSATTPKQTYVPSSLHRASPVTHAAYNHPLLVTLSHSFTLMIYDLSNDSITHTQTLTSFTSHPPTSLVLSTIPSTASYKLVMAYAIPVYPAHWSVGATELIISPLGILPRKRTFATSSSESSPQGAFEVSVTRSTRAFDIPQGWIDEHKLQLMRDQWGRKVKQVADIQTDGKWVVLAPGDVTDISPVSHGSSEGTVPQQGHLQPLPYISPPSHTSSHLQLYRLHVPPISSSSVHTPKLMFVRTLHGPVGSVSTLSLADGRCVSLSANGAIWVWDLEGGDGIEIAGPAKGSFAGTNSGSTCGTVAFDERRIVSASVRGIEERRFDI